LTRKSKENHGNLKIEGEVLGNDKRKITRIGTSNHVSIPPWWKRLLNTTVVEITLVRDKQEGFCIVIKKPEKREEGLSRVKS